MAKQKTKEHTNNLQGPDRMSKLKREKKPGQKRWEYKKGPKNGRKNGGKMATVNDPNLSLFNHRLGSRVGQRYQVCLSI